MDIDITPVLTHYGADILELEPGERWVMVHCINPDHPEERPSASTNGIGYRCHACGFAGDALALIMQLEDITFAGAVQLYESISGESVRTLQRKNRGGRHRISGRKGDRAGDDQNVQAGRRRRPSSRP